MKIISHRGYWKKDAEKNLPIAFHRSFDLGYGTETDIRDIAGKLVVSHDMPSGEELTLDQLLEIMDGRNLPLAINIKANGLAGELQTTFDRHGHTNWFVFDMAVPDMRSYFDICAKTYTRISDVEKSGVFLNECDGVWLDSFGIEWYNKALILDILSKAKEICVVSSELHGRSADALWPILRELNLENKLMLCTDNLEAAIDFFGD